MSRPTAVVKPFAATCADCGTAAVFAIAGTNTTVIEDAGFAIEYSLSVCDNCRATALYSREDYGSPEGFDADSYARIYPAQKRLLGIAKLPKLVRESYNEAVKCEDAKAWLACAVMVGRTLEAVAKDLDPRSKNLAAALSDLLSKGVISKDLFDWANELRIVRNLAAHAQDTEVTKTDAVEALDFVQAILEILYDLKPKFEKMKARRAKAH